MKTFFATPKRVSVFELQSQISIISENKVIDTVLETVGGLIAVLNDKRQILTVNSAFLKMLGIKDAERVLGLRPGEAIQCKHAHTMEAGCGTSKMCITCGAAISIVTSLAQNKAIERDCVMTVDNGDNELELYFNIRSQPIMLKGKQYILLFLRDYTREQQWASIERAFFHDLNNRLTSLLYIVEVLNLSSIPESDEHELSKSLLQICSQIVQEVKIQQLLTSQNGEYKPVIQVLRVDDILQDIYINFQHHIAAANKLLSIQNVDKDMTIYADRVLLSRILDNLVLNALEASKEAQVVKLWIVAKTGKIYFHVWNTAYISKDVQLRIFQRNFSTKDGHGRGLGTFSAKLFGEKFLNGKLTYTSTVDKGTTFTFCLPMTLESV